LKYFDKTGKWIKIIKDFIEYGTGKKDHHFYNTADGIAVAFLCHCANKDTQYPQLGRT